MPRRAALIVVAFGLAAAAGLVAWRHFDDRAQTAAQTPGGRASYAAVYDDGARTFGLDMRSFVARGRFLDRGGKPFSVGRARGTNPLGECLAVLGPAGDTSEACSRLRLFSRGPVVWVEAFEGGPAPADRTNEYIAGIAAASVKRVGVVQSDGTAHAAPLSPGNAFFFALDPGDLARGVYLDRLEAFAASGDLVNRIALNDGS